MRKARRVPIGSKFGLLETLSKPYVEFNTFNGKTERLVKVGCNHCGAFFTVRVNDLVRGHTTSCGVLRGKRKQK